ncbi:MAG: RNA methyltransferase [Bdellovibrionales bacterium]
MQLSVVLVRTETPGNIGAVARAMANMGATRLVLIDPKCSPLHSKSRQMAATAQDVLLGAVRYDSWDSFYQAEGEGVRIALSRRCGKNRKVYPLEGLLRSKLDVAPASYLYLIFGPEADGLAAEDLAYVNFTCYLPVQGDNASLNLSQAVLLALHVARQAFPAEGVQQTKGENAEALRPFYFPDQLIKDWLTAMGFDVSARRASAYITLRRLFLQNQPSRHEYQVLEAILQQNIRKLQGESKKRPERSV